MIPKSSAPKSSLLELAEQAHAACEPLERGQASKPLTEALRSFCQASETPLSVSILCLDPAARQGIAPESDTTSVSDRAIAWRIADCKELRADVLAYQNFCRGSHALLVVGSGACQLENSQLEVIRSTAKLFPLVWPIIVGDDETSADWLAAVRFAGNDVSLAPGKLAVGNHARLEWSERLHDFREPLLVQKRSIALVTLLEKLSGRAEHELAYLADAQSRLEVPTKIAPARGAADSDKELAPVRERLAEQSSAIDRHLTLKSDRSTQPLGELSGMMRSICTSLNIEDLDKTRTSALLKLSISASHLARINRRIEHALRQEFVNDLQQVQRQMRESTEELFGTLRIRIAGSIPGKLPVLDVNQAWRSVENLMAIGKETHIELPRKGFFDVLTAGRQKVFIIIMFASLMGRMGLPNLFATPAAKAAFGLFMAVVMVGSMISAILHWRREKQLTSEKELSKIRDSLLAEGSKVIDQVERVKLTTMREYLKEAARTFEAAVKQSIEETQTEQRIKREAELQKHEVLRKALDLRLKQATDAQRVAAKLLDQARSLSASALRSLHKLADSVEPQPGQLRTNQSTVPVAQVAELDHSASRPDSVLRENPTELPAARPARPPQPVRPARAAVAVSERPRIASALAERRQRRDLTLGQASER